MSRAKRVIGKLSIWGVIMMVLMWLAKQLLEYIMIIITPWLNWLMGWLMVILAVLGVSVAVIAISAGYLSYRAWRSRQEAKAKEKEKEKQKDEEKA